MEKSYYRLTGIYRSVYTTKMCHYDGKIRNIQQKLTPTSFQAGFWRNYELSLGTFSCIVSQLDCKWIFEFFLSMTLKNAWKVGKLAKFLLVVREPRKKLGKRTKKGRQKFKTISKKFRNFLGGTRTETKCVKWSASRKMLRNAALTVSLCLSVCLCDCTCLCTW